MIPSDWSAGSPRAPQPKFPHASRTKPHPDTQVGHARIEAKRRKVEAKSGERGENAENLERKMKSSFAKGTGQREMKLWFVAKTEGFWEEIEQREQQNVWKRRKPQADERPGRRGPPCSRGATEPNLTAVRTYYRKQNNSELGALLQLPSPESPSHWAEGITITSNPNPATDQLNVSSKIGFFTTKQACATLCAHVRTPPLHEDAQTRHTEHKWDSKVMGRGTYDDLNVQLRSFYLHEQEKKKEKRKKK